MPLIKNIDYENPKWLFNGHMQTIVPALFRNSIPLSFERERISTSDGDFLDLDWLKKGSDQLVIISHGLEGNSQRPYMLGMAHQFFSKNFDVLNWNFRGCSEEMNKKPIFYHSGATYDLDTVVNHAAKSYLKIFLVGFSLGGNLTLKYLGEKRKRNPKIKKGVAISVPLHLESSCIKISSAENILYSKRFLSTLKEKVIKKSLIFPDKIPVGTLRKIKTLQDFDDNFTGPLHGFKDAHDYYEQNSSLYFIDQIQIPTLILNAQNDPFLSEQCFPIGQARNLDQVWMEFPKYGGHVGFSPRKSSDIYWSEKRAFEFINADH
ncbi:putative hydrolase of the alpha/beta-hydrolase fold protein [Belliella baltica DSM 15883]|uniref:Putative hydrolase of the alpha/beta-hydrolase fold protein n=1 Tax=Belliella baltica (strain DSM 15883 / CIP 108006 / LMG 21964 / BA134) TaxID=866536 RepID=I3Z6G1_BELBD|nr:alpha/beta fold hydrolase [Belliella baltica]AFL84829.1 putative hydrolase of the alpha/beta-hydrolase fold protein [Belliella baltica DSM 15883]